MKSVTFTVEGALRSYWDFYVGFGIAIGAFLVVQAVVLWQIAGIVESQWNKTKSIVAVLGVGFVVNALIVGRFFFALPLVLALTIVGCLGAAALSK